MCRVEAGNPRAPNGLWAVVVLGLMIMLPKEVSTGCQNCGGVKEMIGQLQLTSCFSDNIYACLCICRLLM